MEGIYTFVNFDISVGPMPDPDAEHRRLIIFKINYEAPMNQLENSVSVSFLENLIINCSEES